MGSFLQLIFTLFGQANPFFFAILGGTSEKCELCTFALAFIIEMFAYASNRILISVSIADISTECLEFSPIPLKLVIVVPGLSFLEVEEDVELSIGSRKEAKLRLQIAEHILNCTLHITTCQMLDNIYHSHHLQLLLPQQLVSFCGISRVDIDVLVDFSMKLYGLLDVLRVRVLNNGFDTRTALDMAV